MRKNALVWSFFLTIFFAFICADALRADDNVAYKIDVAIEFANAGRDDISLQQLQKLMQTNLAPVEKATVLYNAATILASLDRNWDAMLAINQINDDMFEKVTAASPLLAIQIAYNGAVCSVGFAKSQLQQIKKGANYTQNELDNVYTALDSANFYNQKLEDFKKAGLASNKGPNNIDISSFLALAQLQEDIALLTSILKGLQQQVAFELMDKTALLDALGALLQKQFFQVLQLFGATFLNNYDSALYMQAAGANAGKDISLGIDRLILYLQAPAKVQVARVREFFVSELQSLQKTLNASFADGNIQQALSSMDLLSTIVLLIQSEPTKSECNTLLEIEMALMMRIGLAKDSPKVAEFWENQIKEQLQFFARYLAQKVLQEEENENDAASLYLLLQKRFEKSSSANPSVQVAEDDAFYWKIVSQPVHKTYSDLAVMLHQAPSASLDYQSIYKTVYALLDRLDLISVNTRKFNDAKLALSAMLTSNIPVVLFQNTIKSWFFVDPQATLSFMLGLVNDKISALHVYQTTERSSAHTDYQLVMHLLSLMLQDEEDGIFKKVYNDLVQKNSWFTEKVKQELDFFTMSLEFSWLKQTLTNKTQNLEQITAAVDFGVEYQKKTLSLLRYSQNPQFQSSIDLISEMQEHLIRSVQSNLQAYLQNQKNKGSKIKQVITLLDQAQKNSITQNRDLASMQAVQSSLEEASKILHSLRSESESDESDAKASSSSQIGGQSQEMQNQTLKLAPQLSIRLLQEMEKDDKSLKTQKVPQATGNRPW